MGYFHIFPFSYKSKHDAADKLKTRAKKCGGMKHLPLARIKDKGQRIKDKEVKSKKAKGKSNLNVEL